MQNHLEGLLMGEGATTTTAVVTATAATAAAVATAANAIATAAATANTATAIAPTATALAGVAVHYKAHSLVRLQHPIALRHMHILRLLHLHLCLCRLPPVPLLYLLLGEGPPPLVEVCLHLQGQRVRPSVQLAHPQCPQSA
eukprot:CAMPEP_0173263006 /NCGR_PEP_ID=MMETSP1142-20121109/27108_1 /TAXON_ID=483371 /ORGANISM="non described non described, Strain CCMP2298" /LENGTH=141 /DNA_ID=CAMNT_0014198243 /DNA_START=231 /DNA_END=653 /DNA_ORIENTATION=+